MSQIRQNDVYNGRSERPVHKDWMTSLVSRVDAKTVWIRTGGLPLKGILVLMKLGNHRRVQSESNKKQDKEMYQMYALIWR